MEVGQQHEDIDVGHVVSHDVPVLLGVEDLFIPDDDLDVEYPEHGLASPGGDNHKLPALLHHTFCREDEENASEEEKEE